MTLNPIKIVRDAITDVREMLEAVDAMLKALDAGELWPWDDECDEDHTF